MGDINMRIKEVISDAEKRSVELKKQAAKTAALSAKKAAATLSIRKANQKLQKLNTTQTA